MSGRVHGVSVSFLGSRVVFIRYQSLFHGNMAA